MKQKLFHDQDDSVHLRFPVLLLYTIQDFSNCSASRGAGTKSTPEKPVDRVLEVLSMLTCTPGTLARGGREEEDLSIPTFIRRQRQAD